MLFRNSGAASGGLRAMLTVASMHCFCCAGPGYGMIVLDDCNFHETVNVEAFESQRSITFQPPEGEFTVMNYRSTGDYTMPFRVFPFVEDVGKTRLDLLIRVRADLAASYAASNMVIRVPIPRSTSRYASSIASVRIARIEPLVEVVSSAYRSGCCGP